MTKLKLKEGASRTGDITLYGHVQINLLTLCAPCSVINMHRSIAWFRRAELAHIMHMARVMTQQDI